MNIEELETEWSKDCRIDEMNLATESANVPFLHSKYYRLYIREKLKLEQLRMDQKEIEFVLERFYKKELTKDELEEYELIYPEQRIINSDVPKWVHTNNDNIAIKKKIITQNEKVEFLKSILDQIGKRSFHINNAISWKKFEAGE